MEKFSYSKELLLYEKNNSITNDLCDDIISIFENNNENVPKSLTQKMEKLIENYDVQLEEDTKEMRTLKDYLQTSIYKMRNELLEFIKLEL